MILNIFLQKKFYMFRGALLFWHKITFVDIYSKNNITDVWHRGGKSGRFRYTLALNKIWVFENSSRVLYMLLSVPDLYWIRGKRFETFSLQL